MQLKFQSPGPQTQVISYTSHRQSIPGVTHPVFVPKFHWAQARGIRPKERLPPKCRVCVSALSPGACSEAGILLWLFALRKQLSQPYPACPALGLPCLPAASHLHTFLSTIPHTPHSSLPFIVSWTRGHSLTTSSHLSILCVSSPISLFSVL